MNKNNLNRFTDRAENYARYRPVYPLDLLNFLQDNRILLPNAVIADIGSGTGISSELFLNAGYNVIAIEPNTEMRLFAENAFASNTNFKSIAASAEHTSLEDKSVDLVLAAQSFHWFKELECRNEFRRILKEGGKVLLVWNDRRIATNDFLKSYEDFLQLFATDYKEVNHKNLEEEKFTRFFGSKEYAFQSFFNYQDLDFEGLKGRVLSSSYMPNLGHTDYEFMLYCLKKIFLRYQQNGKVRLEYDTKIYYGTIK